jgi:tetratricopeptide (TPR) repeat protein
MKKLYLLFLIVIACIAQQFYGQSKELDSLFQALSKANTDTGRIRALGQISEMCDFKDIQKYSNQIIIIAEANKSITDTKSKRIFLRETARAYNNIGVYYHDVSKFIDALENYQKAALIVEKDNLDYELQNSLYNNIAAIEMQMGKSDKALKTVKKCLETDLHFDVKNYIATDYNNISGLYNNLHYIDSALYYGLKSIEVREKEAKTNPIVTRSLILYYTNVGGIYIVKGDMRNASKYLNNAYGLSKKSADSASFSSTNYWKAMLLINQKRYLEAKPYLKEALKYANRNNRVRNNSLAYKGLYIVSDSLKDYKNALNYYKLLKVYTDSSMNIEMQKEAEVKQIRFEFEEREIATKAEQGKKDALTQEEKKKARIILFAVAGGFILVGVFSIFLYRRIKITQKQKRIIELQKEEVQKQKEKVVEYTSVLEEEKKKVDEAYELLNENKQELEKSFQSVKLLSEIGQHITSCLTVEKIFDTIYENVNKVMNVTEFWLGIYNEEKKVVTSSLYIYKGERIFDLDEATVMNDPNRLSVWCVQNKKEVFINDIENEYSKYIANLDSYNKNGGDTFLLQSVICIPLLIDNRVQGLITVQSLSKNSYTEYHLNIVRNLSVFTSIALENAFLYDKVEQKQKEVEQHHKETMDSIQYASRIQRALITSERYINNSLNKLMKNN